MNCNTDIDVSIDFFDDSEVYIETAKTQLKCTECYRAIEPGEQYEYIAGRRTIYRTCMDCVSLKEVFFTQYNFGQIWEDFHEHYYGLGVPEACISQLTPAVRTKVCEWIERKEGD